MSSPLDYDEPATLLAYGNDQLLPHQTRVMTLAEAVRSVIEESADGRLFDVFIATPHGTIQGMEEVRAIYQREDFPLPRPALQRD